MLEHAHEGGTPALPVSGGVLLGDDGFGTVCGYLSVDEVALVAGFLSAVEIGELTSRASEVLSGVIHGGIPVGYLEDLGRRLGGVRDVYVLAAQRGLCVAWIHEG